MMKKTNHLAAKAATMILWLMLAFAGVVFAQTYILGARVIHKSRAGMVTGLRPQTNGSTLYKVSYTDGGSPASVDMVPYAELTAATPPPPPAPKVFVPVTKTPTDWVAAHNTHRRVVGSPDLTWSTTLATMAQGYADLMAAKGPTAGCVYNHNLYGYQLDQGKYGENIGAAMAPVPGIDKTAAQIIQQFADEKPNFDPVTSRCKAGTVCGHYTQVVSQLSTQVGCGVSLCTSGAYTTTMYVCNYAGPGNVMTTNGYKNLYPGQR